MKTTVKDNKSVPAQKNRDTGASSVPGTARWTRCRTALAAVALTLITAAVYIPLRRAGFVWDDTFSIEKNPFLRSGLGLEAIWCSIGLIPKEAHFWPLTYTTLWLDWHLWGPSPLGYHVVNLLWHVANTLLVWRLLKRLNIPGAWLAALLFGIHPVHVESVAWAVERKDVLSGFFYLASFLCFVRREQGGGYVHYLLAILCFTLAMLSKSVAMTFPLALLVYFWWRDGRLAAPHFRRVAPFLILAVLLAGADTWAASNTTDYIDPRDFVQRVLLAARSFWVYALQNVWPELRIIYPRWRVDPNAWTQYLAPLAIIGLLFGLWGMRQKIGRGPLALTLFYGLTLGPMLGLVGFEFLEQSFIADRFQYLACIAPLTFVAVIFGTPHSAFRIPHSAFLLAYAAFAVFLGALTWRQVGYYQDDAALFGRAREINPPSAFIYGNLGAGYLARHDWRKAEENIRLAIDLRPDYGLNYNNLAYALVQMGRITEAIPYVRLAIQHRPIKGGDQPPWPEAMSQLAWYLATYPDASIRNPDEAIQWAGQALTCVGPNPHPHFLDVLAAADAAAGHFDEAVQIAQAAANEARSGGLKPLADEIQARAENYKKHQPYVDHSLNPKKN